MGYGSGMSNSLKRFEAKLAKTDYFVATLTGPAKDICMPRVVLDSFPVKVEDPIVWEWREEGLASDFKNYRPRCLRLDTNEQVYVHFNEMEPMNAMEVLAWVSK